jgi:hypothetical protein
MNGPMSRVLNLVVAGCTVASKPVGAFAVRRRRRPHRPWMWIAATVAGMALFAPEARGQMVSVQTGLQHTSHQFGEVWGSSWGWQGPHGWMHVNGGWPAGSIGPAPVVWAPPGVLAGGFQTGWQAGPVHAVVWGGQQAVVTHSSLAGTVTQLDGAPGGMFVGTVQPVVWGIDAWTGAPLVMPAASGVWVGQPSVPWMMPASSMSPMPTHEPTWSDVARQWRQDRAAAAENLRAQADRAPRAARAAAAVVADRPPVKTPAGPLPNGRLPDAPFPLPDSPLPNGRQPVAAERERLEQNAIPAFDPNGVPPAPLPELPPERLRPPERRPAVIDAQGDPQRRPTAASVLRAKAAAALAAGKPDVAKIYSNLADAQEP